MCTFLKRGNIKYYNIVENITRYPNPTLTYVLLSTMIESHLATNLILFFISQLKYTYILLFLYFYNIV